MSQFSEIYGTLRPLLIRENHDESLLLGVAYQVRIVRSRFDANVICIAGYPQCLSDITGDREGCFVLIGRGYRDIWLDYGFCDRLAARLKIPIGAALESYLFHEVGHFAEPGESEAWALAANLKKEFGFYSEASFEAVKRFSLHTYGIR